MFTACIFCNSALGSNEVVERFPVGRRLAFDPAKGRLWVVCARCERWNLTPLETRWEAVEECERRFRITKLRVSTDNIALARLSEGLELVRIGAPLRPEFAAWRYGDQFGRRRRRALLVGGGVLVATGAVLAGATMAGIGLGGMGGLWGYLPNILSARRAISIKTDAGRVLRVRGSTLSTTKFVADADAQPVLLVEHTRGKAAFRGDEALRHGRKLVPAINRWGGNRGTVREAVAELEESGGPESYIAEVLRSAYQREYPREAMRVSKLSTHVRLALEMALHEDAERRATEGELELLEKAWREAEEIASISDDMFVPDSVEEKLRQLKRRT